jgi:hypothetical protein
MTEKINIRNFNYSLAKRVIMELTREFKVNNITFENLDNYNNNKDVLDKWCPISVITENEKIVQKKFLFRNVIFMVKNQNNQALLEDTFEITWNKKGVKTHPNLNFKQIKLLTERQLKGFPSKQAKVLKGELTKLERVILTNEEKGLILTKKQILYKIKVKSEIKDPLEIVYFKTKKEATWKTRFMSEVSWSKEAGAKIETYEGGMLKKSLYEILSSKIVKIDIEGI